MIENTGFSGYQQHIDFQPPMPVGLYDTGAAAACGQPPETIVGAVVEQAVAMGIENPDYVNEVDSQKDIIITEEIKEEIVARWQQIMVLKDVKGVLRNLGAPIGSPNRVFTLKKAPGLIFKINPFHSKKMSQRIANIIMAQKIIKQHGLSLLIIPNPLKEPFKVIVGGEEYSVFAEWKLNINPHKEVQEQHHYDHSGELNRAIGQLFKFIWLTGFSDVKLDNIPVLENSVDEYGNWKIVLLDLEEMEGPTLGLFGGSTELGIREGLVRFVSIEQGEMIGKIFRQITGMSLEIQGDFEKAQKTRRAELEVMGKVQEYYKERGIITGREPINIDIKTFKLTVEGQDEVAVAINKAVATNGDKLKQVAHELIARIQAEAEAEKPSTNSIRARRSFFLNITDKPFYTDRSSFEFLYEKNCKNANDMYLCTFVGHILKRFAEEKIIFNVNADAKGFCIQA